MKIIKLIIFNLLVVALLSSILKISINYCLSSDYYGSHVDLEKSRFYYNDQRVSPEEFANLITQDAMKYSNGPGVQFDPNRGKTGLPATSTPTNTMPASTPTKKTVPKVKLTVWFTDALGRIIGSSQVTKGTDIADSQFPAEVSDCEGITFDHWDYDGRLIEHEYIVRAIYK